MRLIQVSSIAFVLLRGLAVTIDPSPGACEDYGPNVNFTFTVVSTSVGTPFNMYGL
jgi:hypothetical protein